MSKKSAYPDREPGWSDRESGEQDAEVVTEDDLTWKWGAQYYHSWGKGPGAYGGSPLLLCIHVYPDTGEAKLVDEVGRFPNIIKKASARLEYTEYND